MSAPPIPPGFLDDLQAYSVAATGRRDQYRPVWNGQNWVIQYFSHDEGGWSDAIVVIDRNAVTRDNMTPYAPLTRDVFDILMEADIVTRYGASSLKDAHMRREIDVERKSIARELAAHDRDLQRLADIFKDNINDVKRLIHYKQYGHTHGFKAFY